MRQIRNVYFYVDLKNKKTTLADNDCWWFFVAYNKLRLVTHRKQKHFVKQILLVFMLFYKIITGPNCPVVTECTDFYPNFHNLTIRSCKKCKENGIVKSKHLLQLCIKEFKLPVLTKFMAKTKQRGSSETWPGSIE